jgi:hypothetical protein
MHDRNAYETRQKEWQPVVREVDHDIEIVLVISDPIPHRGEHRSGWKLRRLITRDDLAADLQGSLDLVDLGPDMQRTSWSHDLDVVAEGSEPVNETVKSEFDSATNSRPQGTDWSRNKQYPKRQAVGRLGH